MNNEKVGIMGGTFDPIHIGHLILAEYARVKFKLDRVVFIPTGVPPHKYKNNITPNIHRYNMTLLAANSNKHFCISSIEMDREGITYTIDTIKHFKSQYKDTDFYFLLGADSLLQIHKWKDYKELLGLCNFIVAKRPDYDNENLELVAEKLNEQFKGSIYILNSPLIDISSTEIRNRVKNGLSIKYLVPEAVETYIYKNSIYKGKEA